MRACHRKPCSSLTHLELREASTSQLALGDIVAARANNRSDQKRKRRHPPHACIRLLKMHFAMSLCLSGLRNASRQPHKSNSISHPTEDTQSRRAKLLTCSASRRQKPVEPRSEKQLFRSRPLRPQNSTKTEIIAMMNPICFRNNVTARNRASHLTSCVKTTSSESLRLKPWRLRPKHRKQTP